MKSECFRPVLAVAVALPLIIATPSNGQSFLTNGLIAYYPFNGNANDESGNGNDGIISSNCWLAVDRFGNAGHAIYVTNYQEEAESDAGRIDIPADTLDSLTAGTISAWVKPDDIASGDIIAKQHSGINTYAVLSIGGYVDGGGQPTLGNPGTLYFHSQNSTPFASSASAIATQTWQQVVVVFTDNSCSFYINGILCGTNAGDYGIPGDLDVTATSIGCLYGGYGPGGARLGLVGAIDDVRIYNRALTICEVQQLYQIENSSSQGNPKLDLGKAVYVKFSNLNIGYSYQLQTSTNMTNWTDSGAPFAATMTNMTSQYWNVDDWNQLFFRLR